MMSAMPPGSRSNAQDSHGPVELLLAYTQEILTLEANLRRARIARRFFRISVIVVPLTIIGLYAATILTWRKINLQPFWWPGILIILGLSAYIVFYIAESQDDEKGTLNVPKLELDLELARERRRLHAAAINLPIRTQQLIYRDGVPVDIERFQIESRHY